MRLEALISLLVAAGLTAAQQETILGAYIFSRHGDRNSKSTPPVSLTDLGYQQVYTSGNYYRNRYIANGAARQINGISNDIVDQSQITASAPSDNVLQNSAQGFLQGLYPPVGQNRGETLRNGTVVQSPLNGYQLIPVNMLSSGGNSESSLWLQGSSGCDKAQRSSNDYYSSDDYQRTYNQSMPLYQRIYPDVQGTFNQSQTNYKNAYAIWDLLNVARVHNSTATLPNNDDFSQLQGLASQSEYNLAYSPNSSVRAISGSMIGGEVLNALNSSVYDRNQPKLNVQFGTYAAMLSYFGLSNLTNVNSDFFGIPDYASTMVWEIITNTSVSGNNLVSPNDTYVRFYFHNGTATNDSQPVEYPLFNTGRTPLPWNDFVRGTQNFSVSGTSDWCKLCGNSTGLCSTEALQASTGNVTKKGNGISKAVAGVIGAMVTLGVLGALAALGFCLFRSRRRKRVPVQSSASTSTYRNEYVTEPKPAEYRTDYTTGDYRTRGSIVSDTAPLATTTRDMTTATRDIPTTVVTEPVTTGVTHPTTVVTDHHPTTTGIRDTYSTTAAMREQPVTTGLNSGLRDTVTTTGTGIRDHTTTGLTSGIRDTVTTGTTGLNSGLRDTVTTTGTRGVTGTTGNTGLGSTVTGARDLTGSSTLRDGYSTTAMTDHQPGVSTGIRDTVANASARGQQTVNTALRGKNTAGGTVHDATTSPV